jgi:hypothetical protein
VSVLKREVDGPIPILKPPSKPLRTTVGGRWLAGGISLACLIVLLVAAYLEPDPAGVGTEARLGMSTCNFLERTGLPCAGCGMTTSFSHFVRLHLFTAIYVQPAGALLAVATVATFWIAGVIAVTGRPVHRLISRPLQGHGAKIAVLSVAFFLLAWGWKMGIVLLQRG